MKKPIRKVWEEGRKYSKAYLENNLSKRQKIFCHAYIVNWEGKASAVKAGYKEKNAGILAHRMLQLDYVKQYIEYIKDDIEKECKISKVALISELKKIAFSSIAKMHNTWVTRKDFESLSEDDKACIESIESSVKPKIVNGKVRNQEFVKIKLYNKEAAIETINKMMGYNANQKIDVTTEEKINFSEVETDELVQRAELIKTLSKSQN